MRESASPTIEEIFPAAEALRVKGNGCLAVTTWVPDPSILHPDPGIPLSLERNSNETDEQYAEREMAERVNDFDTPGFGI